MKPTNKTQKKNIKKHHKTITGDFLCPIQDPTHTHFFDQSLSETPGFSENSATGSQSACQISMFFQRMHVIRSSTFAFIIGPHQFYRKEKTNKLK
jgi:hypothetical protein